MRILQVPPSAEQIELSIKLRHFITDWPAAQRKFVAGITRRLHVLSAIQPHDLSMNYASSLGDAACACRLFKGAGNIVLNADTLKLSFADVLRPAYEVVFKTIRHGWEFVASEFPENGIDWFALHSSQDVAATDDAAVGRLPGAICTRRCCWDRGTGAKNHVPAVNTGDIQGTGSALATPPLSGRIVVAGQWAVRDNDPFTCRSRNSKRSAVWKKLSCGCTTWRTGQ